MTRWQVREWLAEQVSPILMTDPLWNGGVGETRKIANLAETFGIPLVLHNLSGPICHAVCMHVGAHIPNLFFVESSRALYRSTFGELTDYTPIPVDGHFAARRDPVLASTSSRRHWQTPTSSAASVKARGWLWGVGPWAIIGGARRFARS